MSNIIGIVLSFDFIICVIVVTACILGYKALKKLENRLKMMEMKVNKLENEIVEMNEDVIYYDDGEVEVDVYEN